MTDEASEAVVAYRLDRARETLEDARILADAGRWDSCVNRLYYACFYAVTALLLQHSHAPTKHTGVRGLFNLHFVKPGQVPKSVARIYNDLFERRQESDYVDFARFSEAQVRPWIAEAQSLVDHLARLIDADRHRAP